MVSQKANLTVDPTQWTRPFPMHTYLARVVKLKWALLYTLMLMFSVIKDTSIYNKQCGTTERESVGFSPVSFHIGIMIKGDNVWTFAGLVSHWHNQANPMDTNRNHSTFTHHRQNQLLFGPGFCSFNYVIQCGLAPGIYSGNTLKLLQVQQTYLDKILNEL